MSKPDLYNIDFSSLTDEQKQRLDWVLQKWEGVKQYHEQAGLGGGAQFAQDHAQVAAHGGHSPEEATFMSRYRAFKQGALPAGEKGPPRAYDTNDEINMRNQARSDSDSREQTANIAEAGKISQSKQDADNYFNVLTNPKALAAAHESEMVQRLSPVGPPVSAAGEPPPAAYSETAPIKLSPRPVAADDSSDEQRLADAHLMAFQQLANTPYSNEAVTSAGGPTPPLVADDSDLYDTSATDPKLAANLRMLLQYGK